MRPRGGLVLALLLGAAGAAPAAQAKPFVREATGSGSSLGKVRSFALNVGAGGE